MEESKKLSQSEVLYADVTPYVDECDNCKHFICPDKCEHVQSPIDPRGWCIKFQLGKTNGK